VIYVLVDNRIVPEKSVPVGGALLPNVCSLAPPKKAQLRAPLSPCKQPGLHGFDPNLYSSGSSSAGPALVEIATASLLYSTGAL